MAKCPKCLGRKGKRHCPALGAMICSQCCGEHRIERIPCPQDCPHLGGEFYQQHRRWQRAAARGKRFVDSLNERFSSEPRRQFAFSLQADIYYYMAHEGPVPDSTVIAVLRHLRGIRARIIVPEAPPHPLGAFLRKAFADHARYPGEPAFTDSDYSVCLDVLAKHIAALGGGDEHRFRDEISEYFDSLHFEADLDYDPREEPKDRRPARSEGGVILPP